jgi:AraC-like DNA-binding protein
MVFEKFLPSPALQSFIREFVIVESDLEFVNTIIPDTSIVMAFRLRGKTQHLEGKRQEILPPMAISGLRKSARMVSYGRTSGNLLVIFKENGLAAFSKIPAHELFDYSISMYHLFPPASLDEISEQLDKATTNLKRIDVIESFLLKQRVNHKQDLMVDSAIDVIKKQNGIIRIKDLAGSMAISQDPFEKRFRSIVGSTPKQFAKIIRLQNLIRNYPNIASLTEASFDAGYFDQSHFIKDFRLFTGKAPKEFFSTAKFW